MSIGKMERQFVQELKMQDLIRGESSETSETQDLEYLRNVNPNPIIRKMDWKILPVMSILYLLSFLDRTNIGNAKIVETLSPIRGESKFPHAMC